MKNDSSCLARLLAAPLRLTEIMGLNLVLATAAFMVAPPLHASLVVTYAEDSGAINSTLQNTSVINFTSLATSGAGNYTNLTWTSPSLGTVGTIDQVYLQSADQFGGANYTGSQPSGYYPVQSVPPYAVGWGAITPTSLTFTKPSAYFGLWWSAGDPFNTLTFYNGSTQLAQYNTSSLLGKLPSSYYGNPVYPGYKADGGEPFAFLNFYGMAGTDFTKVVFSNSAWSGFESDNWTVRQQAYGTLPGENPKTPPGVLVATVVTPTLDSLSAVPEPSTTLALGLLIMSGLSMRSRRRA